MTTERSEPTRKCDHTAVTRMARSEHGRCPERRAQDARPGSTEDLPWAPAARRSPPRGPDAQRSADEEGSASKRRSADEGRFRDMARCLEGALQDVERLEGHPQDIAAVPNAPLAAYHPAGGRGHVLKGAFGTVNDLNASFRASRVSRTRLLGKWRAPDTCGSDFAGPGGIAPAASGWFGFPVTHVESAERSANHRWIQAQRPEGHPQDIRPRPQSPLATARPPGTHGHRVRRPRNGPAAPRNRPAPPRNRSARPRNGPARPRNRSARPRNGPAPLRNSLPGRETGLPRREAGLPCRADQTARPQKKLPTVLKGTFRTPNRPCHGGALDHA